MENVKIGLMGVGLNTYWGQFEGLLDRLIGYQNKIKNKMQSLGNVTVIDAGSVDDSEGRSGNLPNEERRCRNSIHFHFDLCSFIYHYSDSQSAEYTSYPVEHATSACH